MSGPLYNFHFNGQNPNALKSSRWSSGSLIKMIDRIRHVDTLMVPPLGRRDHVQCFCTVQLLCRRSETNCEGFGVGREKTFSVIDILNVKSTFATGIHGCYLTDAKMIPNCLKNPEVRATSSSLCVR